MTKILTFLEALDDSDQYSKRHLLLGNGFSISCQPDIFHYGSLYEQADFSNIPGAEKIFQKLGTQDFEVVIQSLENAATLIPVYMKGSTEIAELMCSHATTLKDILVGTIAKNHPDRPQDIDATRTWACKEFLYNFIGADNNKNGYVFTLNYDLLLYWTLMNNENPFDNDDLNLKKNDSFGNDENNPSADYVVWQGETAAHSANIFFLHGALHLFDAGSELQKYTWVRSGDRLVDQARNAISQNKFPLFVAEGTSQQKKSKIRHNAYLYQGFKVLTSNAETKNHCFFIFGHSLAENDDHILIRMARGKFQKLYISLYGDPASETNKKIISRAQWMQAQRHAKHPLEISFFDSASANVWGD
ncbi:hypothetical protein O59_001335 [Cellvibrio sp. BR]|uniref:DUF4917 family protein n=1 Tax=unclassified Cellvibrio TaxID=2624793 RepID=UPI00026011B8|nr:MULTISPECIES: DUF4917 family protein [unclassified Cellvibrio]EIK45696.1 hypothetical protein O59_001335 [Cellvibrio sp. BR]UUA73971.1 DUF4917 family protein [Cellvibrio sp. QJXJ]